MRARQTLSREDWIHAAQRVLVKSGIESVRVDNLAKELRITRGSFYYHFENRCDLLEAVLSNWRGRATESVIRSLQQANVSPRAQILKLMELPLHGEAAKQAAAIELAIRAWARRDQKAREAIDEVDSYRLRYIESLLTQMGFGTNAKDVAFVIYSYQLSVAIIDINEKTDTKKDRHQRICDLLLDKTKSIEPV